MMPSAYAKFCGAEAVAATETSDKRTLSFLLPILKIIKIILTQLSHLKSHIITVLSLLDLLSN